MNNIKVLIAGATGLVGGEILRALEHKNQAITLLSRRELKSKPDNIEEIIINFDDLKSSNVPNVDHLYIALGTPLDTTELLYIRESKREQFRKVDFEHVISLAKIAFAQGARSISVVSAVGSNAKSKNLYLSTKGQMEDEIMSIGYEKIIFAQPGHLLGKRVDDRFRPEIPIMEFGARMLEPFMLGPLKDIRFIKASDVAYALVEHMNKPGKKIIKLKYANLIRG